MKKTVIIQFFFPWEVVSNYIDYTLKEKLSKIIKDDKFFASLELDSNHELIPLVIACNITIDGKNLIRIIRYVSEATEEDLEDHQYFEFDPLAYIEEELRLKEKPISYYDLKLYCSYCGRYAWVQKKELELKSRKKVKDISITENWELIVSQKVKKILSDKKLQGLEFRRIKGKSDAYQLDSTEIVKIQVPPTIIVKKDICSKCGLPRIVSHEDNNNVDIVLPPYNETLIEKTPVLYIKHGNSDFAKTDLEFGTIGKFPVESESLKFTYKTFFNKWVVSNKFCKALYENNIKNFSLIPVVLL